MAAQGQALQSLIFLFTSALVEGSNEAVEDDLNEDHKDDAQKGAAPASLATHHSISHHGHSMQLQSTEIHVSI